MLDTPLKIFDTIGSLLAILGTCLIAFGSYIYLPKKDYTADKAKMEEKLSHDFDEVKKSFENDIHDSVNALESKLREKAEAKDFIRMEREQEQLKLKLDSLIHLVEQQNYRFESLASIKTDLTEFVKDIKQEFNRRIDDLEDTLKADISELREKSYDLEKSQNELRIDFIESKSRLENHIDSEII